MESALLQNIRSVMVDASNGQLLNGSGSGDGTINGLFNRITDGEAPGAGASTYSTYNTSLLAAVDGIHALERSHVRAVFGLETYRQCGSVFRANNSNDSALDLIERYFGGVRASAKVPDAAANIQQAILRRANPAGGRVAVFPVWEGIEMIRDVYGTNASKGTITLTGVMLVGDVVVLRSGAFVQDSFRLAA